MSLDSSALGPLAQRMVGRDGRDRKHTDRNFKDLEEMLGNPKALKRTGTIAECRNPYIGPWWPHVPAMSRNRRVQFQYFT
jgi:hypothetical protein